MKKMLLMILLIAALWAQQNTYSLERHFEVKGRQGVATDGHYYYISGSLALYKYSKEAECLLENTNPFAKYKVAANHIGDIDVYNGEIFVSAEYFEDGVGKNIQIGIHDAETLEFKRSFPFSEKSGQQEVSGICVDRDHQTVWMCSWVGENSGDHLYEYSLATGEYLRKILLDNPPKWQQGIYYYNGNLYLSADDGDAEKKQWDSLYRVEIGENNNAQVFKEYTFNDIQFPGEAEGLSVDFTTNELLIHFNRGKKIILGMPKGFYPGYDREIHEVYVYKIITHKN